MFVNVEIARLAAEARAGSRKAFGRLVELHWTRLVRLARPIVGDANGEDAVQDALITAWTKLPSLRAPEAFSGWVERIVVRHCLREARGARESIALAQAPADAKTLDPIDALCADQLYGLLPPRQRAVLHMTVAEGMSDGEIARVLDIAPASVRAHRRRARETLQRVLGETRRGRRHA